MVAKEVKVKTFLQSTGEKLLLFGKPVLIFENGPQPCFPMKVILSVGNSNKSKIHIRQLERKGFKRKSSLPMLKGKTLVGLGFPCIQGLWLSIIFYGYMDSNQCFNSTLPNYLNTSTDFRSTSR